MGFPALKVGSVDGSVDEQRWYAQILVELVHVGDVLCDEGCHVMEDWG